MVTGAVLSDAVSGGSGVGAELAGGAGLARGAELAGGAELACAAVTGASADGWVVEASEGGCVVGGWVGGGGCVAGGTSGVSAGNGVLTSGKVIVVALLAGAVFSGEEVVGGCGEESLESPSEQAARKVTAARAAIASLAIFWQARSECGMITCRLVRHGD